MRYWLLKSEPSTYAWQDLCQLGCDHWDGVRNYQARNNLLAMRVGDKAFFYHSDKAPAIVGLVDVTKAAYPDHTEKGDHKWVMVDVVPLAYCDPSISLARLRQDSTLQHIALVRHTRLSVQPLDNKDFVYIKSLTQWHYIV